MKRIVVIALSATMVVSGTFMAGCSSGDKTDKAREKLENEEEDVKTAKQDLEKAKIDSAAAYDQDRLTWQQNLEKNDKDIADYKIRLAKQDKAMREKNQKRLLELEQKNKELKAKLEEQKKKNTSWEQFKREFNHDMDELGKAFKDIGVKNTK